jgi:hypothetical protein
VGLWGGNAVPQHPNCLRCSAKYPVQEQSRPSLSPLGFCSDLRNSASYSFSVLYSTDYNTQKR